MSRSTQFALTISIVVYPFLNCQKTFHICFGKLLVPKIGASLNYIQSELEIEFATIEHIQGIVQIPATFILQPNFYHIIRTSSGTNDQTRASLCIRVRQIPRWFYKKGQATIKLGRTSELFGPNRQNSEQKHWCFSEALNQRSCLWPSKS